MLVLSLEDLLVLERQASLGEAARVLDSEPLFVMDSRSPEAADVPGTRCPCALGVLAEPRVEEEHGQVLAVGQEQTIPIHVLCSAVCPLKYTSALPLPAPVCPSAAPLALLLPSQGRRCPRLQM